MKGYVLAFGAVMLLVGAGVDYDSQSRALGMALGQLSPQAYAASIPQRIDAYRAEQAAAQALAERQAVPPVDHLGPAPEGWTRRAWTADDEAALHGLTPEQFAAWKKSLQKGNFATGKAAPLSQTEIKTRERSRVIYQKGQQIVEVAAIWKPLEREKGGITNNMTKVVASRMEMFTTQPAGFAFVDGVAYLKDTGIFAEDANRDDAPFITVSAQLGAQVELEIRSRASDASTRDIIAVIDHDALNAMLDQPSPDIGSHMPAFDVPTQIELAATFEELERARQEAVFAEYEARIQDKGLIGMVAPLPRAEALNDEMRAKIDAMATAKPKDDRAETGQRETDSPNVTERRAAFLERLGGASAPPAAAAPDAPADGVTIRRPATTARMPGEDACTTQNGVKRCRVGD